jgi:hypothetical protein
MRFHHLMSVLGADWIDVKSATTDNKPDRFISLPGHVNFRLAALFNIRNGQGRVCQRPHTLIGP